MDRGNSKLRGLDQNLGPILLRLIQFFRWSAAILTLGQTSGKKRPLAPHRIGIIKAAALGDTILVSAIISDLRKAFPSSEIFLFVGETNAALARLLAEVDKVQVLPLRQPLGAVKMLREARVDWMIDTDSWPRLPALWTALSKAKWTIGFKTAGQKRHYAFDQVVEHDPHLHELENLRALIRAMYVPAGSPPQDLPGLTVQALKRPGLQDFMDWKTDDLIVALHLWPGGTRSEVKEWPAKNWLNLMAEIAMDQRWKFVLTGGPDDHARNTDFLDLWPPEQRERCFNGAGLKLEETVALLRETEALISVNTGILHLAAAIGKPVLGLHGPTNPKRWGPVGEKHISVLSSHKQAAVLNLGFEYPNDAERIMPALRVGQVLTGWNALVEKNQLGWRKPIGVHL